MIGYAVLRLVVGADLLGTIAMADLALTLRALLCLLTLQLHLIQASTQHLHADLAILDLRALVLGLNDRIGRQVGNAHCGIRGINALSTRARSAVGINTQIFLRNLNINLVRLRQNRYSSRGRLDAPLGFSLGNTLHTVHAALKLHNRVDLIACNLELDSLETAGVGRTGG